MNWRAAGIAILKFLAFVALVMGLNWAVMYALVPLASAMHWSDAWMNQLAPAPMIIGYLSLGLIVVVATGVMALVERRSVLSYGFSLSPGATRKFFEGAALGVINPAIIALLMLAFGGMQIRGFGLHGADWLYYPIGWAVAMLLVGFFEEAIFRGYGLVALARGIGFWPAAIIVTLLFGAAHMDKMGENPVDIMSVMFIGFTIAITFLRTGSLWLAAGFHFAFDYMQFFVIGTRNGSLQPVGTLLDATFNGPAWVTGGALGTEASYFVFPVTLGMLAYILWRYRENGSFNHLVQSDPGTPAVHTRTGQA
jgi:membrane protease YdiL (CAAX protease family)